MGFMVATESALGPRAYFSLQALTHYLEREVRLEHQVFQLRLLGMFSALPLDWSRRDAAIFPIRILNRVVPVTSPSALVTKHCSLFVPPACSALLDCVQLLIYYLHVHARYINT